MFMGEIKILKASAGSGKTYQLAYNYIRQVIENPLLYRNILAVTFTNKATEEMKKRIIEEVNRLASGAPSGYMDWLQQQLSLSEATVRERAMQARTLILHNYTHFTVVTIDKFFQRILRAFIKELGLELDFSLELQTDSILERATDRMIEAMADNPTLCRWIVRFAEEKIDQNGKWDVRREIIQLGGELFKEQYERLNIHPMEPELL
ncbi:MAG: UvrD-helicase domain-containing protein, partial [Alistipes sp.]|nr:UvrD-helicase domain-containing protein [Alistipes sp.]